MARHAGRCHCGDIQVVFETAIEREKVAVRTCGCAFCQRMRPIYTSDPEGMITIRYRLNSLHRYQFGHETAEFLSCSHCGTYLGAITGEGDDMRGVLNFAGVLLQELIKDDAPLMDFEDEDPATRAARRAKNWTPVRLESRSSP